MAGGRTAEEIADDAQITPDGMLLTFGTDTILLRNVFNTDGLADAIDIM